MREAHVTIVGAGRLGGALLRGFSRAGLGRERIRLIQRKGPTFEAWGREGLRVAEDFDGGERPGMIFVAVKPSALPSVIERLLASDLSGCPVLSLASGMTLREWRAALGDRFPVLRARANVLVSVGHGNILLAESDVAKEIDAEVSAVLGLLGSVFRVTEDEMVADTWYSSTLPLVVVGRLIQASLEAAPAGPQRERAEKLVLRAIVGLATLLASLARAAEARGEASSTSAALRDLVAQIVTPGGMNAAALEVLTRGGFSELVEAARITYQSKEPGGFRASTTEER